MNKLRRISILFIFFCIHSLFSETIPARAIINYKTDLAYILNVPITVVGSDYQSACAQLASYNYEWKIVSTTNINPACYSPTNHMVIGVETWYCADGTLAYYNSPWWSCNDFYTCPNASWSLSSDGLNCTRPNPNCGATFQNVSEKQLVAAIIYGEASVNSTFEEKAAIGNALIRKRNAYHLVTVNQLIKKFPNFSAAVADKNIRYSIALCADIAIEYPDLDLAVSNALDPNGIDYANGGCFWDGKDLLTLGSKQQHYDWGYTFTNPNHNVYNLTPPPPKNEEDEFGFYDYTLESTAGYGGTVFWKYTKDFMKATRTSQCH